MTLDSVSKAAFSILLALCMGISAWSLKTTVEIDKQLYKLIGDVEDMQRDTAREQKQSADISKHWKILGWSRDQINSLRHSAGEGPASWPNFD